MLPKIEEEKIKYMIRLARQTEDLEDLKVYLPIWMADKASIRRRMTEDEKSELIVNILERFEKMWLLSLEYDLSFVAGFFVTYAFNLFRNDFRKTKKITDLNEYVQLWNEKKESLDCYTIFQQKLRQNKPDLLDELPKRMSLAMALRFDLPLIGNQRKSLEWRLMELGRKFDDFQRIYDKKKEYLQKKLDLYSMKVVRYTRLLLHTTDDEKRRGYAKKKKFWVLLRDKALSRCLFSEREIALILGITRKETRSLLEKGQKLYFWQRKDLLHCA